MSIQDFTQHIHGEISPNITERELVASTPDSLVVPVVIATIPVVDKGHESTPKATVTEEGSTAVQGVVLRPLAISVASRDFDWENDDVKFFTYVQQWRSKPLFEVGYLHTSQGLQVSERRVLPKGQGYSSVMVGVERPVYRRGHVERATRVLFVENELAAHALNQRLGKAELGEVMVATTTAGGLINAHRTNLSAFVDGREVVVLPGHYLAAQDHADTVCRACAQSALSVQQVHIPGLLPNQTQEDYFRSLEDLGELLELIEDAPTR